MTGRYCVFLLQMFNDKMRIVSCLIYASATQFNALDISVIITIFMCIVHIMNVLLNNNKKKNDKNNSFIFIAPFMQRCRCSRTQDQIKKKLIAKKKTISKHQKQLVTIQ